ncbi:N-acetylmuramoyl-L-alanine amidase [Nocardia abscessus]|uniref:N-acetylmuramoyl-L-alanine amidase n=1 Tax=Nocardia abscessus TaxID=120957 RepID=UPI0024537596|nr:N-acetylmuramoyl-L-alanine amidase [Nocardia abscessus]
MAGPDFIEIHRLGNSSSGRSRPPVNFLLHTQEGNGTAESLANYLNNPANGVSYHYTLRDGVLVAVVDTDRASWSVLDANAYTINLCFAGSFAGWSRAEWMERERDIEIAAYVAVQDCRKYNIPIQVIEPPYFHASGISDHRYVTDCLGIGTHTDVGDGFPWDVFSRYVAKWSGASPEDEDEFMAVKFTNDDGHEVDAATALYFIDKHVGLILDQLGGPDTRKGADFPGWEALGGDTVVEAIGKLRADVDELKKRLA